MPDATSGPIADTPVSVWQGELQMCGVTLRVHVLDDGTRIIEAADLEAFFEALANGADFGEEEAAAFARWQRGGSDD